MKRIFQTDNKILSALLIVALLVITYGTVRYGVVAGLVFSFAPILIFYIGSVLANPRIGLISIIIGNYFVMGFTRYIDIPWGTAIDALFFLTYLSLILHTVAQKGKIYWGDAKNPLTFCFLIWFIYGVAELANPLAHNWIAWFYVIRGNSLYFLLTVVLTFILFNRYKDLRLFMNLWAVFTLLAVLKGVIQYKIGLDFAETRWMNEGGYITHALRSGLRVFSFFTDAGNFGSSMGQSGIVFLLWSLHEPKKRTRLFYIFVSLCAFIGMFLSGTRGAIAAPFGGLFLYLLLSKNWKIIFAGSIALILVFVFFKYTTIGESKYTIRRMRTAFVGQDRSLLVRWENQRKLKAYMADKPFGCGLGTSGDWAKRFAPHSYLASIPTDSWYVGIWVEEGILGLITHLLILFYILVKGSWILLYNIRHAQLAARLKALLGGFFGIMLASYSNGLMGQFPVAIILSVSLAMVFMGKRLDEELIRQEEGGKI